MQFITTGAQVPPYKLVTYNRYREVLHERSFKTKEELAAAAYSNSWYIRENQRGWDYEFSNRVVNQKAFSPNGKLINVAELVAWATRLSHEARWNRPSNAYVFRRGSVPGIRGWGGGPGTRPYRVQAERRLNAFVLAEEGEVPARACRQGFCLPDSWDGRPRTRDRSWKAQHKGRKSWDRPEQHGPKSFK